jgi:hypothetical protein
LGFAAFSTADCLTYLDYCIRRLSAYRNIFWSLANEYDLIPTRNAADWDTFVKKLKADDPYGHLISIHHCLNIYPKAEWMTHCSIQTPFVKRVPEWRREYGLPVIVDECGYEGDIEFDWGNLSAFETVHLAWTIVAGGGFATHGETFFREDEVLWWAKGGALYGQSPARFAFLKALQYEIGGVEPFSRSMPQNPNSKPEDGGQDNSFISVFIKGLSAMPEYERQWYMTHITPSIAHNADYRLQYFGRQCPCRADVQLPENGCYKVEVMDVWAMTRTVVLDENERRRAHCVARKRRHRRIGNAIIRRRALIKLLI